MRWLLVLVLALVAPLDAGVQNLDFSDEPDVDQVTPRDPSGVTFESTLPARFVLPDGGEPEVPRTRPRGGCAGCSAGAAADPGGALLVLAALALAARASGRPGRGRREPGPRPPACRPARR